MYGLSCSRHLSRSQAEIPLILAVQISRASSYYDNEEFHKAIYAASRSEFLEEQCLQLHRRLRPYRRLQLRVRNRLSTSFSEHCAIVDAIFAGNGEDARRLLRGHVGIQGERFSDLVASMAAR
ncbi:DNA-binding GntR family transcriptional regulator [Sinorhizobium fredii]|uniref:GntR family transcriptional regulator n=2 Tax=Sinorhizobium TaxID=28105 RepID=A0A178YD63_9HYPH|nr:GntR family transcriptional regulator [Sinorhizobium glycinis]GEC35404.1 hypothetical protein EFR01_55750 [Sinorhizobium fredii]GLS12207.1 hypothetical protein GCM10007864_58390 [Sinorhizobium fredii]CCE98687.1 GntR family transcriptional regulator [Sinorhizobium fredii HH103]